jgi:formiminotetrahydrofolate cyclodeaminase
MAGLASDRPVPAGGSAAAAAVAMAAALAEKAAKLSGAHWSDAARAAGQAEALRLRATELIDTDAHAYMDYVEAVRSARGLDALAREVAVGPLRSATVDVPLAIIRVAGEVVGLGAQLAGHGNPNLRSDAVVATLLAGAAAQAGLATLSVNIKHGSRDPRLAEARSLARAASARARSLTAPAPRGGPGRAPGRSRGSARS